MSRTVTAVERYQNKQSIENNQSADGRMLDGSAMKAKNCVFMAFFYFAGFPVNRGLRVSYS